MKRLKRVFAWIGILLLLGLYITTIISAIITTPATVHLFKTSIIATIFIPILVYVFMFILKMLGNKDEYEIPDVSEEIQAEENNDSGNT